MLQKIQDKTFEFASFVTHLGSDGAGHDTATVWDRLSERYSFSNDSAISTGISEANKKSDTVYIYCYVQAENLCVIRPVHDQISDTIETPLKRNESLPKVHPQETKNK